MPDRVRRDRRRFRRRADAERRRHRAARALAREYASLYLGLPNYTQNLRTFGFGALTGCIGDACRFLSAAECLV